MQNLTQKGKMERLICLLFEILSLFKRNSFTFVNKSLKRHYHGKKVASFEKYEIFMADQLCLDKISRFIVKENYVHHLKTKSEPRLDADIFDVFTEENYLYSPNSKIYIARTLDVFVLLDGTNKKSYQLKKSMELIH